MVNGYSIKDLYTHKKDFIMKKLSLFLVCSTLVLTSYTSSVLADNSSNLTATPVVTSQQKALVININQASADDFTQLKGVGQKKAQAIVQYRQLNGNYHSIDDLLKVKGIGKKILLDNKGVLTI